MDESQTVLPEMDIPSAEAEERDVFRGEALAALNRLTHCHFQQRWRQHLSDDEQSEMKTAAKWTMQEGDAVITNIAKQYADRLVKELRKIAESIDHKDEDGISTRNPNAVSITRVGGGYQQSCQIRVKNSLFTQSAFFQKVEDLHDSLDEKKTTE